MLFLYQLFHYAEIMRLLWLFIFTALSLNSLQAQTQRALIVGIGIYPEERGWGKIHGDNDIPMIREALAGRGFYLQNIMELRNEQATKKSIVNSLNALKSRSQQGDNVFIHFSCHGQQVVDLDGDEEDGYDEAIIPYDANKDYKKGVYEGENHLIDDELNRYLTSIRKKIGQSGTLLVVIDACHSGGGTRGESAQDDSLIIRGTDQPFLLEGKKLKFNNLKQKLGWVVISASQSYQNNYEYRFESTYFGSLSYAVKLAMGELKSGESYSDFFSLIQIKREQMKVSRYPQRPMIEGIISNQNQKAFTR